MGRVTEFKIVGIFILLLALVGESEGQLDEGYGEGDVKEGNEEEAELEEPKYTIHLIPHSHQDVGWLNTADGYYDRYVHSALNTVIQALTDNPNRTYIQNEMYFLHKWWNDGRTTDDQRNKFKEYLSQGRIEITTGGWCSNDEATTHYLDIISQIRTGQSWVEEIFKYKPHIAWHVDQFGHSAGMASILSQMGFDVMLFSRDNELDISQRKAHKDLQFMWRPFEMFDWNVTLFTNLYFKIYTSLGGLCFDKFRNCPHASDHSMNRYKQILNNLVNDQINWARSTDIKDFIYLAGDDFAYSDANYTFTSLDMVIEYVNRIQRRFKIEYSTPSKYYQALFKESIEHNVKFSEWRKDFYPLRDSNNAYWVGYFSTRAPLKLNIRMTSKFYHAISKMFTLYSIKNTPRSNEVSNKQRPKLQEQVEELSLSLHHDASTGTSPTGTANDYYKRLSKANDKAGEVGSDLIHERYQEIFGEEPAFPFVYCFFTNESVSMCNPMTEFGLQYKKIILGIFNPSKQVVQTMRFPLPHNLPGVKVSRINPHHELFESDYICQKDSESEFPVCFVYFTDRLESLSYTFYVAEIGSGGEIEGKKDPEHCRLHSPYQEMEFMRDRIELGAWEYCLKAPQTDIIGGQGEPALCDPVLINIEFRAYHPYSSGGQKSGFYIMRVQESESIPYVTSIKETILYTGRVIDQLSIIGDSVIYHIRLYKADLMGFEIESDIISGHNGLFTGGKEVVLAIMPPFRNTKGVQNRGEFYTDANGLGMQKREIEYNNEEHMRMPSNLYPVNTAIVVRSDNDTYQLIVMPDRAEGGTYINNRVELVVHRIIHSNDGRGINEQLQEMEQGRPIRLKATHFVILENLEGQMFAQRYIEQKRYESPLIFYSPLMSEKEPPRAVNDEKEEGIYLPEDLQINLYSNGERSFFIQVLNQQDELDHLPKFKRNVILNITDLMITFCKTQLKGKDCSASTSYNLEEVSLNHQERKIDEVQRKMRFPYERMQPAVGDFNGDGENKEKYIDDLKERGCFIIHPQVFRVFKITLNL